ncbi:hypothetical protein TDB9533_03575 [Thalassocella blandensis]|nr:hypothetical protein TDB9533_03575 [Thalassocella blandensis]
MFDKKSARRARLYKMLMHFLRKLLLTLILCKGRRVAMEWLWDVIHKIWDSLPELREVIIKYGEKIAALVTIIIKILKFVSTLDP